MYVPNKGSCIPRDFIQSSRRVRKFASDQVHFCLNNQVWGMGDDNYPMLAEEVKANLIDVKRAMVAVGTSKPACEWLVECDIHNKVEEGISRRKAPELYKQFFELENITGYDPNMKSKSGTSDPLPDIKFDDVPVLTDEEYAQLLDKSKSDAYTDDEKTRLYKRHLQRFAYEDHVEELFEKTNNGTASQVKLKRALVRSAITEMQDNPKLLKSDVGVVEFEKLGQQRLNIIKDIKGKLGVESYTETGIRLEPLLDLYTKEYVSQCKVAFEISLQDRDKKPVVEVKTTRQAKQLTNAIYAEWSGATLPNKGEEKRESVDGRRPKYTTYKFDFPKLGLNPYAIIKPFNPVYNLD